MTTVVIDCSTGVVAADSQTTSTFCDKNGRLIKHTTSYYHYSTKVHKVGSTIFVAAGDRDAITAELRYYTEKGCISPNPTGDFTIALVQRKGTHIHVDIHESNEYKTWWGSKKYKMSTKTVLCNSTVITFGSGGKYAYAAMKLGRSAKEAVELAASCDPYTNTYVTVEEVV